MFGATHTIPYPSGFKGSAFYDLKPAVNESLVLHPSDMMAIGDGFYGEGDQVYSGLNLLWRHYEVGGFFNTGTSFARHRGKANIAFCDGHVESPTLKFMFEDRTDLSLARWNRDGQAHREKL
jgi:prepilin-type processing-associated H-X9-DG protein